MIKDNEVLVLKAVEGQLLNNIYIIGKNGAALGRHSASNDIVISESFVSWRHCEIKYINGKQFNLDFTKFLKSNFYLLFWINRAAINKSKKWRCDNGKLQSNESNFAAK